MPTKPISNAARRQAKFRQQAADNGWVQCNVWVPSHALADMQLLAQLLRANTDLTVGPARDTRSGKVVALRSPKSRAA